MVNPFWIVAAALTLQVPPPHFAEDLAADRRGEHRAILSREAAALQALGQRLSAKNPQAAEKVRALIPADRADSGASRFVPLAEVAPPPAPPRGLANIPAQGEPPASWEDELRTIRATCAKELFALAEKVLKVAPSNYALADECLRGVVARLPDHAETRRLLGFVPHQGGWATPYAVRQLREKRVRHDTYGWVPASWVEHLDKGELPAPSDRNQKQPRWLPTEEADALHGDWENRWKIFTEHFEIHTNVPLAEAIVFGRHLEDLHELFYSLLADLFGTSLPLAQRFHDKKRVGEPEAKPHIVYYFASQPEYVDYLTPLQGPDIAQSLGLYIPPRPGGPKRLPAYFFRDARGLLPVTATLYHEVSHQLLFESGVSEPGAFEKNDGNYWVFEGLGTYFETLETATDGSLRIGGTVGRRMERAVERLVEEHQLVPTAQLVRQDQKGFNAGDVIFKYQEANALCVFLMQAEDEKYRAGFLDYVRDAAKGRLKRVSGRSLEDRVGLSHAQLDEALIAYLKAQSSRARE